MTGHLPSGYPRHLWVRTAPKIPWGKEHKAALSRRSNCPCRSLLEGDNRVGSVTWGHRDKPWQPRTAGIYSLVVPETKSSESGCQQGSLLLEALRKNPFRASLLSLVAAGNPWLVHVQSLPRLSVGLHVAFSPLSLCAFSFSVS